MNANQQRAICAKCRKVVEAGKGRFIGPGIVVHREPCQRPSYIRASDKVLKQRAFDLLKP